MSRQTGTHAIGLAAAAGALSLALAPFPLTLLGTLATALSVAGVCTVLERNAVSHEFAATVLLPVAGLCLIGTPGFAVYELGALDPRGIAVGVGVGLSASTAAATAVVLGLGGVSDRLPERTFGIAGQLLVPFGVVVVLIYIVDQLRLFAILPTPVQAFVGVVTYPGETSQIAGLLLTPLLATVLCLLCAFLLGRPVAYGLLTHREMYGRLLTILSRTFLSLAGAILAIGWGMAVLLMLANIPGVSLPAVISGPVDIVGRLTQEPNLIAALVVGILVTLGIGALASPFLFFRLAGWIGTQRFVRYIFPGAFAISAGLSAAFLVQQLFVQTPQGVETLNELGDPAWQLVVLAPVLFTALPLVGATVLFVGAGVAIALLRGKRDDVTVSRSLQTVVLASLFGLAGLSAITGTATALVFGAAICAVVAWDSFEYGETLAAELPNNPMLGPNELVHAAGITGVAISGTLAVLALRFVLDGIELTGETLPAALVILAGTACLLYALDEAGE